MPFRFIHTADLHLDSPLRSLALRDSDLAELIGTATRRAFSAIIDLCLAEEVDALMIAGDLYDSGQTSMKTALFLATGLRQLTDAGIRVFIVRGNHDSASQITRELSLPEGVTVFGRRAGVVTMDRPSGQIPVAVHGVSFHGPEAPESLVPRFGPPLPGTFNIGLLHTSLGGSPGHDIYAPCSVQDLVGTGFDYWCLGHIHRREVHSRSPFVVMPGMPQGRDIGEAGPKSVTLVHVRDDGTVDVQARPTGIAQFERVRVDLAGAGEWSDYTRRVTAALEPVRDRVEAEFLIARLHLNADSPLIWNLRRDPEFALAEARACADAIGQLRLEKLDLDFTPAETPPGPISDLGAQMRGAPGSDQAFQERAHQLVEIMSTALPRDARRVLGESEQERQEVLDRLIAEGCETVLAFLGSEASGSESAETDR